MHCGVLHRSFFVCHVGHCDFTDKIVVNINLLDAMPAGFIRFMDHDFLYKRIEQFGEQYVRYRVFMNQLQEAVHIYFLLLTVVNDALHFLRILYQCGLLPFVISGHLSKSFIRQLAGNIIFIDPFNDRIYLGDSTVILLQNPFGLCNAKQYLPKILTKFAIFTDFWYNNSVIRYYYLR